VFKYFDKNNDGVVSFPEFVAAIRGPLSNAKA
jgi:Ca2+-binding EF-hand superfamily protein